MQNRIDTIYDKSIRYLKHVSSYNVVDFLDIAHNKFILDKILKKRKFDYLLKGKQIYNNHKVFVINTTLKDTTKRFDKIDATLYIDTATYAFVAANIYIYNLLQFTFLTNKILNYRVDYEKIGNKWYLLEGHVTNIAELKNQLPQSTVDFIRIAIDSVDAKRIPYKDIIQPLDDVLLVDKLTSKQEWAKNDSIFKKAESEGRIEIVSNTLLDTIKTNNVIANPPNKKLKTPFGKRVLNYIAKDNIRTSLGLIKFPFVVKSQLYTVPESINYGSSVGANYRLYKNLFLGFQLSNNFWNKKKINLSTINFNLSNDFVFNKNSRSIILTPYAGYSSITANYGKSKINYNTFDYGLRASYELTRKKALFISSSLNSATGTAKLNELTITPNNYVIGFGIIFKK